MSSMRHLTLKTDRPPYGYRELCWKSPLFSNAARSAFSFTNYFIPSWQFCFPLPLFPLNWLPLVSFSIFLISVQMLRILLSCFCYIYLLCSYFIDLFKISAYFIDAVSSWCFHILKYMYGYFSSVGRSYISRSFGKAMNIAKHGGRKKVGEVVRDLTTRSRNLWDL